MTKPALGLCFATDTNGSTDKKQKKKRAAAEEEEGQQEQEQEQSAKKAKKEKKEKRSVAADSEVVVAEVGDADLARNGKPIVKQLYKEHPEVAKLTAEKVGGGVRLQGA